MSCITEDLKKEVQEILDRERWQGFIDGKIEGALNIIYALDIDKDMRVELLMNAVGLCRETATEFIDAKEAELSKH